MWDVPKRAWASVVNSTSISFAFFSPFFLPSSSPPSVFSSSPSSVFFIICIFFFGSCQDSLLVGKGRQDHETGLGHLQVRAALLCLFQENGIIHRMEFPDLSSSDDVPLHVIPGPLLSASFDQEVPSRPVLGFHGNRSDRGEGVGSFGGKKERLAPPPFSAPEKKSVKAVISGKILVPCKIGKNGQLGGQVRGQLEIVHFGLPFSLFLVHRPISLDGKDREAQKGVQSPRFSRTGFSGESDRLVVSTELSFFLEDISRVCKVGAWFVLQTGLGRLGKGLLASFAPVEEGRDGVSHPSSFFFPFFFSSFSPFFLFAFFRLGSVGNVESQGKDALISNATNQL
mmetsp:Transcript_6159/g.15149  ORF Transcript_6159/g.15149 Transcript_6159/m.15149 type:complete len:341 (-) Transcript_6159:229-1251(-)